MAIFLLGATDPNALLDRIVQAVKEGKDIKTWRVDEDGMLIHTPGDWAQKGRFMVTVDSDGEVGFRMKNLDDDAYPYLHGRLVELLMSHFLDGYKTLRIEDLRSK